MIRNYRGTEINKSDLKNVLVKLESGFEKDERIIEKLVRQQVDIHEMELGLYQSLNYQMPF